MSRFQRGWLKKENRKNGNTWVFRHRVTVTRDSREVRVEHKVAIGLVSDLPRESDAWAAVERLHLNLNRPEFRGRVTFGEIAHHYIDVELGDQTNSPIPKASATIAGYKRVLKNRCIPKWDKKVAVSLKALEIENWFRELRAEGLADPTVDKTRRVMSLVYKHAQRYELIPKTQEANRMIGVRCRTTSDYEAMTITPEQAWEITLRLENPERVLTVLAAATALRISECLGLQWADVAFEHDRINVRRSWSRRETGRPKSKASKAPVPMGSILAEYLRAWQIETPYAAPTDWVFPSTRLHGTQPRVANMLVEDYLRPAAVKAGVLRADDEIRFGFHNLRHSLATFLNNENVNAKTIQSILRHADVRTTLGIYTHANEAAKLAAQAKFFDAARGGIVN